MKKIIALSVFIFAFMSCVCQKKAAQVKEDESSKNQQMQLPKIEYVANTRGFYQKITIENKEVSISKDRDGKDKGATSTISDADWSELVTEFLKIKVEELATLKDPTQKRFYDGAAIANLKISDNGKEYQTVDFDHGFPPAEIERFVNKIVLLGKTDKDDN